MLFVPGDAPMKILHENEKAIVDDEPDESIVLPPKAAARTNGNFVILNKNAFSQMKTVKRIPDGRVKKFYIPRSSNIRQANINSNGLSSLVPKNIRLSTGMNMHVPKFANVTRPSTTVPNGGPQTNGRPASPKSGILIKRNHLKNITVRKVNFVQSKKPNDATTPEKRHHENGNDSTVIRTQNPKDESLKNLIAELEN